MGAGRTGTAILVVSCDKYFRTWGPCCHGLKKYWPDREWPLIFLTGLRDPPCGDAFVKFGADKGWSDNLIFALSTLKVDIVLLMVDDLWLTEPVQSEVLSNYAGILEREEAECVRLFPPRRKLRQGQYSPSLYIMSDDEPYRVSTHAGLWRWETLLRLLVPDETPHQFEHRGTERSKGLKMLCVEQFDAFRYVNRNSKEWCDEPVWRGRWTNAAFKYAKREEIEVDFSRLPSSG